MGLVYFDFHAETTNIFGTNGLREAARLAQVRLQEGSIQHDGKAVEREPTGIAGSAGANTRLAICPAFDSFQ
jgi:hypothetical protein